MWTRLLEELRHAARDGQLLLGHLLCVGVVEGYGAGAHWWEAYARWAVVGNTALAQSSHKFTRPDWLMKHCVQAAPIHDAEGKTIAMRIVDDSDISIHLKRLGDAGPTEITLERNRLTRVPLDTREGRS